MEKRILDWEGIERDYRAGILSVREIAKAHNITHRAIIKKAERLAWSRDLAAKIKAKADELVSIREVSSSVSNLVTTKQIIDTNAQAIADIRLAHRKDIREVRELLAAQFKELESATELDLRARIACSKAVSETLKNLIGLESEAWGFATIPDAPKDTEVPDPMEGARRIAFALTRASQQPTVH
jgi:hypothetical protein